MYNKIKEHKATQGCEGCCFKQSYKGAKECEHSSKCFAHLREDRMSVIFKYRSVKQ